MNSRNQVTDARSSRAGSVSGSRPRRSRLGARQRVINDGGPYIATLLIGEILVWAGQPLDGAVWYGFWYVVLINVIIRARSSVAGETAAPRRFEWRAAVLLSVVVADRLLVLSIPPFQRGRLDIPGLWAVPLLIGGILLTRSALLEDAWPPASDGKHRPWPGPQSWLALPPALVIAAVVVASVALGTVSALAVPRGGWRVEHGAPAVVAAIVVAFAVQEWLYRRVVQPVAMRVWGVAAGSILASGLAAFGWLAAIASIGSINAVTLAVVTVASAMFGYVAAIQRRGVWLAALGCATVMAALLLYPSGPESLHLVRISN